MLGLVLVCKPQEPEAQGSGRWHVKAAQVAQRSRWPSSRAEPTLPSRSPSAAAGGGLPVALSLSQSGRICRLQGKCVKSQGPGLSADPPASFDYPVCANNVCIYSRARAAVEGAGRCQQPSPSAGAGRRKGAMQGGTAAPHHAILCLPSQRITWLHLLFHVTFPCNFY